MKLTAVLVAMALAFTAGFAVAQNVRPQPTVQLVNLPPTLKLPAVGNIGAVRQWKFGRLQSVETRGATGDVVLTVRTGDGTVIRIVGPRQELRELALASEFVRFASNAPIRAEYAERMVAYDVDENGRLIAVISLEPVFRDPNRLRRALGQR
jgi:hypothetical protein